MSSLPAGQSNNRVDDHFSGSKSKRNRYSGKNPMFRPPIDHERTPQNRPRHRPRPARPSSHPHPCHLFENDLHDRSDTHQKEEPPSGNKFRPTPNAPYTDMVD